MNTDSNLKTLRRLRLNEKDAATLFYLANGTINEDDNEALKELVLNVKKLEEESC